MLRSVIPTPKKTNITVISAPINNTANSSIAKNVTIVPVIAVPISFNYSANVTTNKTNSTGTATPPPKVTPPVTPKAPELPSFHVRFGAIAHPMI